MLIRKAGETSWSKPATTAYSNEQALQTLLQQSPELLPGSGLSQLAIVDELPVASDSIDLLNVSDTGQISIIECKLRSNPQIRREVVGQILAYAGSVWGLSYEQLDQGFQKRTGKTLSQTMSELNPEGWDEQQFRATVQDNLDKGQFCLVIAVDEIKDELKQIVQFLNTLTRPELQVLAIELQYVADKGVEILLPTVYGEETIIAKTQAAQRMWNKESLIAEYAKGSTPQAMEAMDKLFDFIKERSIEEISGTSTNLASITFRMRINGEKRYVAYFYEDPKGKAKFALLFKTMVGLVSNDKLSRLAIRLRTIPGATKYLEGLEEKDFKRQPAFPLNTVLVEPGAVETIQAVIEELLQPE